MTLWISKDVPPYRDCRKWQEISSDCASSISQDIRRVHLLYIYISFIEIHNNSEGWEKMAHSADTRRVNNIAPPPLISLPKREPFIIIKTIGIIIPIG